jgi:hypothetical protein
VQGPEPGAAVRLRNQDADPALLGEGVVEVPGKLVALVPGAPVLVVESPAEPAGFLADRLELASPCEIHARQDRPGMFWRSALGEDLLLDRVDQGIPAWPGEPMTSPCARGLANPRCRSSWNR